MSLRLKVEKSDFVIEVFVGDKKEVIDIRTAMKINNEDLVTEYTNQPSFYAWYAALLADQEDKRDRKKREREEYRSRLDLQIRQGAVKILDSNGVAIKLTEGGIQNYINNDERMQAFEDAVQDMEAICSKIRVLVLSSIQRKDMLIQLGLIKRQEMSQLKLN